MSLKVINYFYCSGNGTRVLYSDWNLMIQNSFEKYFYIPIGIYCFKN